MRTTLSLEDQLAATLKQKAAEKKIPFKTLVHQALQLGLDVMETPGRQDQGYKTPTRSLGLKPGYDHDTLGRTADEMDDESMVRQKE